MVQTWRARASGSQDGAGLITVSIVSHGHGAMVGALVSALKGFPEVGRIVVTRNVPDEDGVIAEESVSIVENREPKGFGTNHNATFSHCQEPFFCVLNPDIEFRENPFPALLNCAHETKASLVAPLIATSDGKLEDNARYFPTIGGLLCKLWGGADGRYAVAAGQAALSVNWVAGMFMLFRSADFARLGGFDERYFLYYEDVDLCRRAWRSGMKVALCPQVTAIHDARRASHRSFRYLRWHLASMARYFSRPAV